MLNVRWLAGLGTPRKEFFIVFMLLFNAFTWYYMTLMVLEGVLLNFSLASAFRAIFFLTTIGSSIAGSVLSDKVRGLHLLYFWMAMGSITSFMLTLIYNVTIGHLSIIFILLGISFGLGMPSCLAYLADNTSIENRGRISALIFLFVNLAAFPLAIIFAAFDLAINSIILAVWRGLGLVIFAFLKPKERNSVETRKHVSFSSVFHDKSFTLYLIPWLMFNIIDALETALLKDFVGSDFYELTFTVSPVIASFSILLGGLLSDRMGRKRVVMYGFVSLGVAYAIIGVAPMLMIAWYFYLAIDAIATGILWVTFILILWGDLSPQGVREKYYVTGSMPFFAIALIPLSLVPISSLLPASAAFSLASFFLFLAVLPLMYAPETLPEKKMEIRRLKGYIEQAKKFTEKYAQKSGSKS
jgi:MFS family permease